MGLIQVVSVGRANSAEKIQTNVSLDTLLKGKQNETVTIVIDQQRRTQDDQYGLPKPKPAPKPIVVSNRPSSGGTLSNGSIRTTGGVAYSCVLYVEAKTGKRTNVAYARQWPINSHVPSVGSVVVLNESWYGHVAIVTGLTTTIKGVNVILSEANYVPGKVTQGRELPITSPDILGYQN